MKRQKDGNRIVFQSLAMVTQFGLNMLVPICMMSALGVWLDRKLGTACFTMILFAAGAAAGGQNIYRLAKRICGGDIRGEDSREAAAGTAAAEPDREREDDTSHESDRNLEKHE